jgi:hypothetical protein
MKKYFSIISICFVFFSANGQTNVSGRVGSNTTWTKAKSPYIVTDNVVVGPNVTLTIQSGVNVLFSINTSLTISGAKLIAIGTESDSITFTSNSPVPDIGSWEGIDLNDTAGGVLIATFSFCNFRYALGAIVCNHYYMYNVVIKNSTFFKNYDGIINYGYTRDGGSVQEIDSCTFNSNRNGLFDIVCKKINYCRFVHNQNGFLKCHDVIVNNCLFDSNIIAGISTISPGYSVIKNCSVTHNGVGIIDGGGMNTNMIFNNNFENNSIGIKLGSSLDFIRNNKFCKNGLNIDYESKGNTSMPNNFWCMTDSLSILKTINDGNDSAGLGIINFMPIDTNIAPTCENIIINFSDWECKNTCSSCSLTAIASGGVPPYTYWWNTPSPQTTQTIAASIWNSIWNQIIVCVKDSNRCIQEGYKKNGQVCPYSNNDVLDDGFNSFIFPNPNDGVFRIENNTMIISVQINNLLGENVLCKYINSERAIIDMSEYPKGLYFCRIYCEPNIIKTGKVILQ